MASGRISPRILRDLRRQKNLTPQQALQAIVDGVAIVSTPNMVDRKAREIEMLEKRLAALKVTGV